MIQIIYFDGSSGTGAMGRERGDGSMGTGAWGWHHGNGTMGTAPSERQKFFYDLFQKKFYIVWLKWFIFTGALGREGKGSIFFYICFKKYFTSYDSNDLFWQERGEASVGKRAWERECGNCTVGTSYDSNDYFDGSMGTFFLVVDFPILYSFLEFHDKIFLFLHNMIPHSLWLPISQETFLNAPCENWLLNEVIQTLVIIIIIEL